MPRFFKKEEKRPFTYPTIQEHREGTDYTLWIIGAVLLLVIASVAYFFLK